VGAYHFIRLCDSFAEQTAWFIKNVPTDPDSLPPALDLENNRDCGRSLGDTGVLAGVLTMLTEVEKHSGKRPVLYTGTNTGADYLKFWSIGPLRDFPIWVAKYSKESPILDRPWQFWQYGTGLVGGFSLPLNRNVFYGTEAQWQDFIGGR
jgi:lysozyme